MSFENSCRLYYMPSVKFSRSIGQHITAITCFTWAIIKHTEHLTKKHRDNLMLRVIKGTDVRAIKSAAKPGASNHLRSDAQPLARLFDTRQTLQTWSWTFFIYLISRGKKTTQIDLSCLISKSTFAQTFTHESMKTQQFSRKLSANEFTCNRSLTLSMGATAVLEMAAAMPPARKSFMKLTTASDMVG